MAGRATELARALISCLSSRLRIVLAALAIVAALAGLVVSLDVLSLKPSPAAGHDQKILLPVEEPPETAEFIQAYTLGDYATLERVASPLFFAEWERQGVSRRAQASLIQNHQRSDSGEWLRLTFLVGQVDARGYRHLIYAGNPVSGGVNPILSIWRVDVGPDGRVIWIDMVWLLSEKTASVDAILPTDQPDESTARAAGAPGVSGVLYGARSSSGLDGYYGIRQAGPPNGDEASGRMIFYAVDADGRIRRGAWAFGERIPGRPLPGRGQQPGEPETQMNRYLASLR